MFQEEIESENKPEFEEEQNSEIEELKQEPKPKESKRKNNKSSNVFEYVNQN